VFALLANELRANQKETDDSRAENVLDLLEEEILFANVKETGFSRYFLMPALINGQIYTLQSNDYEIVLNISNTEYVRLFDGINGTINITDSLNASMRELRVTKIPGEVIIEHCANCGYLFSDCLEQTQLDNCGVILIEDPIFDVMCQELHGLC